MVLRPASGRALYQQIADVLRERIYRGELPPGAQLPSEQGLIEQYEVSRNTVRLAVGVLVNEGLVESGQGKGSFVRRRAPLRFFASRTDSRKRRERTTRDAFQSDTTEQGRTGSLHIEVGIVYPPEDIASRLGLAEGEAVAVRRRIQYVDGDPYATADTYFPLELVRGTAITQPDDIPRGANAVLDDIGHAQVRWLDEVTVRMPTTDEVHRLKLSPGTPVAILVRTGYDTDEIPVRVFVTVLPGDRYTLVWEVTDE